DQGGGGVLRAALDAGAFDSFHFPDGMISVNLEDNFGSEIDGSTGQHPGTDSPGAAAVADMGKANGFDGTSPFAPESYDAAALLILAMQAAGSSASADLKDKVMEVANAPGEKIYPGELAKALKILADGGDVDYVGGSAVELIGPGESAGNYRQIEISGGKIATVRYR
ncbi:MAG: branched-chain amino acid ABC transporter substrate-binding protein, partial [Paracoccaceae bacterium]